MSADTEFYKRHYKGGITLSAKSVEEGTARAVEAGGRYALVAERLRSHGKPSDRLVELGCGHGQVLMSLAQRHALTKAIGVDVVFRDPQTVQGVEFRNYNLNDPWPFDDSSIDHLVAMMVFEHLFDPFHCFDEVRRTLAPKGIAYVNLPLVTDFKNRFRLLTGRMPVTSISFERWFDERGWDGNHLHYFSIPAIHRLADACGLQIIEVRGVGALHKLKTTWPSFLASEITFSMTLANSKSGSDTPA